jgi:hypothetical protein
VHRLSTGLPHPHRLSTGLLIPCCPIFGSARFLLPLHRLTWFLLPLRRCNSILLPLHRLTQHLCYLRVRLALLPPGLLRKITKAQKKHKPKKKTKKNPFHWPFRFPDRVLKKNFQRTKKNIREKKLYGSFLYIAESEASKTILLGKSITTKKLERTRSLDCLG